MGEEHFRRSALPSGMTLVTEWMPARRSFALGVWLKCGARDEPPEWLGISHLLEHMMFKGTARRDARAIALSLESLGGHLDAFTSREQVCYYGRALAEHTEQVVDVLADIVCHSRLDAGDLEREKSVVREEILACEDNPEDKIADLLAEQVWRDHALGRPILGTSATLVDLTRPVLDGYFRRRYRAADMVVAAVGDVDHDRLAELVARHFELPAGDGLPLSPPPPGFASEVRHVERDLQQLYISLGTRALPYDDPGRPALVLLNTLLGVGMSSRLFQTVREEAGLAYSVYSVIDFYRDSGMFSIHMGVSPDRAREALRRTRREVAQLAGDGPGEDELAAARGQLKGAVIIAQESMSSRMMQLALDEIYCRRYVPLEEQVRRVVEATRDQVAEQARRVLAPGALSLTALGPVADGGVRAGDWFADD